MCFLNSDLFPTTKLSVSCKETLDSCYSPLWYHKRKRHLFLISVKLLTELCVCTERRICVIKMIHVVSKPINILPQCRRGSNVSLTLDMSSLGNVEPFVAIPTPREKVAMEYLQSASRILTRSQLRDVVASSHLLQSEFMVSQLFIIHSSVGILIN